MAKGAAMFVMVALVVAAMATSGAAQCNVGQLAVCANALRGGTPSATCCSKLRQQQGCYCQYARNPAYAGYIKSANARKTLATCGISIPRC